MLTMLFFLKKKKITIIVSTYLLAVLGLYCSVGFALVGRERGSSLVVVCGLLTVVASLVAVPGL